MILSNLVCGYTCQDHLLLDLDNVDLFKSRRIVEMIQREYPELGVALLVHSSRFHYHTVFDNRIAWTRIVHIIETLSALGIVEPKYAHVRTFRRDLTLRVSSKSGADHYRPAPEPVCYVGLREFGRPTYGIRRYLRLLGVFKSLDSLELTVYS